MKRTLLGGLCGLCVSVFLVACGDSGGGNLPDLQIGIDIPKTGGMDVQIHLDLPHNMGNDIQGGTDTPVTGHDIQNPQVDMQMMPGTDMPPLNTANVGKPCSAASMTDTCMAGAACATFSQDPAMMNPNGVCIGTGCTPPADMSIAQGNCGMGQLCLPLQGTDAMGMVHMENDCLKACKNMPGGANDCGDATLACDPLLANTCIGTCVGDADCGMGATCDTAGFKICIQDNKATAKVGDACTMDTDCTKGGFCLAQAQVSQFTGGYCTVDSCDLMGAFACPAGSACATLMNPMTMMAAGTTCLQTCTVATDCTRMGYTCGTNPFNMADTAKYCIPGM